MQPSSNGQGSNSAELHQVGSDIAAGGSILKGIGGYEAGKFNARVAMYNKRAMLDDEVGQEQQIRDAARQVMGQQIAQQGASGTVLGTGSNVDVLNQSLIGAQLDALNLRRRAAIKGQDYDNQAWEAKAKGKAAFLGGIVDAASAVFSGGADYAAAGA